MGERDVLIVEPDPKVSEVLRLIFEAAGYNCLLALDGREGVEVFKAGRPPLVVTDVRTPGMTAIELLQQVRTVDDAVAVIVLTDSTVTDFNIAIASLKLGAHDFLRKPVNMEELLVTAERALERRQLLVEHREHRRAHGQRQETDRTTLGRADLARRDVLIVEEEPVLRDLLQELFLAARYNCILAGNEREGLKLFRRSRPSLVVTDLKMLMNPRAGLELLQQIRQEDPDAAVIVESAAADVRSKMVCLKSGADAYLTKPVGMDELLIAAERAIERRQLLIERRRRGAA